MSRGRKSAQGVLFLHLGRCRGSWVRKSGVEVAVSPWDHRAPATARRGLSRDAVRRRVDSGWLTASTPASSLSGGRRSLGRIDAALRAEAWRRWPPPVALRRWTICSPTQPQFTSRIGAAARGRRRQIMQPRSCPRGRGTRPALTDRPGNAPGPRRRPLRRRTRSDGHGLHCAQDQHRPSRPPSSMTRRTTAVSQFYRHRRRSEDALPPRAPVLRASESGPPPAPADERQGQRPPGRLLVAGPPPGVETDGWASHGRRGQWERDHERDLDHFGAGVTSLRVTYLQVTRKELEVAARLGPRLLARRHRGASGPPRGTAAS